MRSINPSSSQLVVGVHYGLGKHVLAVEDADRAPPQDLINVFKVSGHGKRKGRAVSSNTIFRQATPYQYCGYLNFF